MRFPDSRHAGHNVPTKDTFNHTENERPTGKSSGRTAKGPSSASASSTATPGNGTASAYPNGHFGTGDPEATETDSSGNLLNKNLIQS